MDLQLSGKIVAITGGSKGIGLACAKAFLAEGAQVAIVSRSQDNVDKALVELPGAVGIAANLSDADEAASAMASIEAKLGSIDVLVNSAGAAKRTPPAELSPAAYRAAFDAKFFSYVNVIDPIVKRMAARGKGVIVNVVGNGGKVATPVHIAGGAANAGLMLVTAGLAAAYADSGVRIVAINPGLTETERAIEGYHTMARMEGLDIEEARRRSVSKIPMGRAAQPQEIANAVLFLASPNASYINGVSISMDGVTSPVVI